MPRTLSLFNVETGETADVRDVSGTSELKIFSMKFQMMCDTDDPWIVTDSAELDRPLPERQVAARNTSSRLTEDCAQAC